jgi:hypothetical protein
MTVSGSTYPGRGWPNYGNTGSLVDNGGFSGHPYTSSQAELVDENPNAASGAVIGMMPYWTPIDICLGGTAAIRTHAEDIIPREPEEPDDAYQRRIFHAVMPPFLQRLAAQAAGTILRKGIHIEGGDEEYWRQWSRDVTGDGTPLNEFARSVLVDALLYGHESVLVDFPGGKGPLTLAEEMSDTGRRPYLVRIHPQQIRGWRTQGNRPYGDLTQLRYLERIAVPSGAFGEELVTQVRVLEPGKWRVYRESAAGRASWELAETGTYSIDRVPVVTVYSNRLATLTSRPPLLEVANLNIAYAQRFCDYHHTIHVGAQPILVLKGFDEDAGRPIGLSVNTAVLLPPDGDAMYVEPTAAAYDSQLRCLQTMEEQISQLGINTLAKQNLTNAAAEAKRLDRIDSDSIMAIISEDLARAIHEVMQIAAKYAGREPPESVTIPQDYENRLIDGNQITAYLQLFMQGAIDQETLLRILQEGEVLPNYIDVDEVITKSQDYLDEQMAREVEKAEAMSEVEVSKAESIAKSAGETSTGEQGVGSGKAAQGQTKGSNTLATPLRPGKHKA